MISASMPSRSRSASRSSAVVGRGLAPGRLSHSKPHVLHLVDVAEHAPLILEEPRSHAVPHPLVLGLHEPVEAVLQFLHARHEELPLGRGLRRPQVGRQIGEVDVIVTGDEAIWHNALLCSRLVATRSSTGDILPPFPVAGPARRGTHWRPARVRDGRLEAGRSPADRVVDSLRSRRPQGDRPQGGIPHSDRSPISDVSPREVATRARAGSRDGSSARWP